MSKQADKIRAQVREYLNRMAELKRRPQTIALTSHQVDILKREWENNTDLVMGKEAPFPETVEGVRIKVVE